MQNLSRKQSYFSKMSTAPPRVFQVPLEWDKSASLAVVIENVFTDQECKDLIARSETQGYERALVNIGPGQQQRMDNVRNNDRCIIDDHAVAAELWKRVLKAVHEVDSGAFESMRLYKLLESKRSTTWHAVGLNERLRILRYDPGTFFASHFDGRYVRGNEAGVDRCGETSFVTCQLYLNDGFEGGETQFQNPYCRNLSESDVCNVVPKTGSVLLFQHNLLHEGVPIVSGRKYVVRTDVMYSDKGPGNEYSVKPILAPLSTTKPKSAENLQDMDMT